MAPAEIQEIITPHSHSNNPRVCFSFAAYAKKIIDDLTRSNLPIAPGLSAGEISAVESLFNLKFPPDLRLFLQEGLPVGPGFPNWRSSSAQQLQILINLPILGLSKELAQNTFWPKSWPVNTDDAWKRLLKKVPVLVPIYRHCYIPCTPNVSGNPVFYINGGDINVLSFDLTGFFQQTDFRLKDDAVVINRRPSLSNLFKLPAWAATEAREIEFWSEVAARGKFTEARGEVRWWSGELMGCMEGVRWRLRDGGWGEEEVREMMDGGDFAMEGEVADRVRRLSVKLLRAGWSREDVADSLGCQVESCELEVV